MSILPVSADTSRNSPPFSLEEMVLKSLSMVAALVTTIASFSARRKTIRSSTIPPPSFRRKPYLERPTGIVLTEKVKTLSRPPAVMSPMKRNSPMWQISNRAAFSRHQRCSAMMLSYWIGMFQPPNGAINAFNLSCSASRGVLFNSSISAPLYR